jgi:NADPH-dependent 2,4-dienoyl-CoA reductase/sulfur reductase-like enzyme
MSEQDAPGAAERFYLDDLLVGQRSTSRSMPWMRGDQGVREPVRSAALPPRRGGSARHLVRRAGGERRLPYDYLVLATGARHFYFGRDDWETVAPGLKKIADATHIREKVLLAFERAEVTDNPAERRRLLTFVVGGGGPTGVEMAGAVAELTRMALRADFRRVNPQDTRVVLVEAGPRVLATFPERLSLKARQQARATRRRRLHERGRDGMRR